MRIPLPRLMRAWREREFLSAAGSKRVRLGVKAWAWLATRPRLYHMAARFGIAFMGFLGRRRRGAFRRWPLAGGWTKYRDLPAPQGRTFQAEWAEHKARLGQ